MNWLVINAGEWLYEFILVEEWIVIDLFVKIGEGCKRMEVHLVGWNF